MAITTRKALATAAAIAMTLISAPSAQASGIADLFGSSDTDYSPSITTTPDTTAPIAFKPGTPMAADLQATHASPSDTDLLTTVDPAPVATIGTGAHTTTKHTPWPNKTYSTVSHNIARIINDHRVAAGEPAMRLDPTMSTAAQAWASEMARIHWFEHDPGQRKHGEIIAMRYNIADPQIAAKFVDQWENSPHHKDLMHRKTFHAMGVGVAHDPASGEVYAVVRLYYR